MRNTIFISFFYFAGLLSVKIAAQNAASQQSQPSGSKNIKLEDTAENCRKINASYRR
jgi:hypothetical protein